MSAKIALTRGQFTLVDDEDFEILNIHKWYASWIPAMHNFYASKMSKRNTVKIHREIMGLSSLDNVSVDHINGNTLDNRQSKI